MPAKLSSDLLFFKHLGERTDHHIDFSGVIRRMQREAVADLIRNQHLLPWTKKNVAEHFFVERRGQSELMLTDREHPIPVSQIKSMVLMAIEAGNFELARKRLVFCWLVPTVLCTKKNAHLSAKPLQRSIAPVLALRHRSRWHSRRACAYRWHRH
ncbi:hypothetical protein [uncultured Novosphingobium sp.]|uniref:hypothetical protein n=1 Tax=uncultured Novosphingobium sp. TaxID=292277 RepID=UPI00374963C9